VESPAVSVVVDNFNYGRFLKQCLESVIAQDYPREKLEIILVDDGSTDDSIKVAEQFSKRVKIVPRRNGGQAEAFNTGLRQAGGDLIMFLDSDDYWDRDKVRVIADCFKDPAIGIVQHPLLDVDADGRALPTSIPRWPSRYTMRDFLKGGAALAAASGLAVRSSVIDKIGPIPWDIAWASDIYMIVHGLFHTDALNFPQAKGYHRIHGANNWAEGYSSPKKLRMGLELQKTFDRYLAPRLKEKGLDYSPEYRFLEDLDTARREILASMYEGRSSEARARWRALFKKHGLTRLGAFRCGTLLLALASPELYVRTYDLYRTRHWLVRLRGKVLPD
jgi:glycosyltransferase involved in cell wall biosynthesis